MAVTGTFHFIPEGHIGIYFRGGALLSATADPGLALKIPLFTRVHHI